MISSMPAERFAHDPPSSFAGDIMTVLREDDSLEVIPEIYEADGMRFILPDVYFTAGRSALRSIRLAMLAAKVTRVERVLDFASGGGRVLRFLKAAFPEAELTACEVVKTYLRFCSEVFGARAVEGDLDPAKVELDGQFDLIWCGSLLSHTDRDDSAGYLKLFESALAPGGVLVFTVMGRSVAAALRTGTSPLSLSREETDQVIRDYEETGFGFVYGVHNPEAKLGEAVASPAWVCTQLDKTPGLRLLLYREESWEGQDVIACTKAKAISEERGVSPR
jgi:SAM-dependent methyltransferase